MDGVINFTAKSAGQAGAGNRHLAAAAAMHRYVPHTVTWQCPCAGAPISVRLPESLSARELLRRAEGEHVYLAAAHDQDAPDRVFEIHYAHLAEEEIEEGIRRLGRCLVSYTELASRHTPGYPSTLIGT